MKTSIIAVALTTLAGLSLASPVERTVDKRIVVIGATFHGAADASYTLNFPIDDVPVDITNPLSVSKISTTGGAICVFTGIDGSVTRIQGAGTVDVGPPQTQIKGVCYAQ